MNSLQSILVVALGAIALLFGLNFVLNVAISSERVALFVQSADRVIWREATDHDQFDYFITLKDLEYETSYYSEQPFNDVGTVPHEQFASLEGLRNPRNPVEGRLITLLENGNRGGNSFKIVNAAYDAEENSMNFAIRFITTHQPHALEEWLSRIELDSSGAIAGQISLFVELKLPQCTELETVETCLQTSTNQ